MCFDQPYCLSEYVFFHDGEPTVAARVSLTTRERAGAVYTTMMVEWMPDVDAWNIWTACDFPSALAQLGIPMVVAPDIMEEVTDRLAESPSVTVILDGGLLMVDLLPTPPEPDVL